MELLISSQHTQKPSSTQRFENTTARQVESRSKPWITNYRKRGSFTTTITLTLPQCHQCSLPREPPGICDYLRHKREAEKEKSHLCPQQHPPSPNIATPLLPRPGPDPSAPRKEISRLLPDATLQLTYPRQCQDGSSHVLDGFGGSHHRKS